MLSHKLDVLPTAIRQSKLRELYLKVNPKDAGSVLYSSQLATDLARIDYAAQIQVPDVKFEQIDTSNG